MGFLSRLADRFLGPRIDAPPIADSVFLQGDGSFSLAIVGESKYARSLERICGRRSSQSVNLVTTATLVLEDGNPHDAMAVRVDIKGLTVGYLARDKARLYRERLALYRPTGAHAICHARIRGGWQRGPDDRGDYGVQLDVDLHVTKSGQATAAPPKVESVPMNTLDSTLRGIGLAFVFVVAGLALTCTVAAFAEESPVRPDRPWFGCYFAKYVSWSNTPLLHVVEVAPASPAEAAGIVPGDEISGLDGVDLGSYDDLGNRLDRSKAGDTVIVMLVRDGSPHPVAVTLTVPTVEQRAAFVALAARHSEPLADSELAKFLPRQLCYPGVTWGEAFALSAVPGTVTMDLKDLQSCRYPVAPCAPLRVAKRNDRKTVVVHRNLKYPLQGDWGPLLFDSRDRCLEVLTQGATPQGAPETEEKH